MPKSIKKLAEFTAADFRDAKRGAWGRALLPSPCPPITEINGRSNTTKENLLDKLDRLNDRNKKKPYGKTRFTSDGRAAIM
jgi:hypothetical protein